MDLTLERRRSGVTSFVSYESPLSPWPSTSTNPISGGCCGCDSPVEACSDEDRHHQLRCPPPLAAGGGGGGEDEDEICSRERVIVEMEAPTVQGLGPPVTVNTSLPLLVLLSSLSRATRAFMKNDLPVLACPQMVIRFNGFFDGKYFFIARPASFARPTHCAAFRCDDDDDDDEPPRAAAAVEGAISSSLAQGFSSGVLVAVGHIRGKESDENDRVFVCDKRTHVRLQL